MNLGRAAIRFTLNLDRHENAELFPLASDTFATQLLTPNFLAGIGESSFTQGLGSTLMLALVVQPSMETL